MYSKQAKKNLTKCNIVVADTTGAIPVTLWESHFKELKLNWYKKKYLGSSTKTTIEKCENIDIPGGITSETENIKPHEKAKKKITGTIMTVEIKKTYICINCKYKITDAPELNIIKCPNCNLKIKKCELVSSTTANIVI